MEIREDAEQSIEEGYGPIYHRRYSIHLPAPLEVARLALAELKSDINRFSPQVLARFEREDECEIPLRVGEKIMVHIPGPWNAPVRVSLVTENAVVLETLQGHIEAGQVTMRVRDNQNQTSVFEIESFARSRDPVVDLFYDKITVARFAQSTMWKNYCEAFAKRVCELAGHGDTPEGVIFLTERKQTEGSAWERL